MTHDELLLNINRAIDYTSLQDGNVNMATEIKALRAVVELPKQRCYLQDIVHFP